MDRSKLVFFSLGVVAQDKIKDDLEIYVWPIEISPNMTGDLTENISVSGNVKDASGGITSLAVTKKKYIKATWLPDGVFNRSTAPDVTKGMTVKLFNFAGTADYFWTTIYNETDLAKREKVVHFYSNKQEYTQGDSDLTSKGYTLTVDTYDKYIKVHTADNDGEVCTYDIEIDAANGVLTVKDSMENSIELKSQDGKLNVNLKEGYVLTTKNVNVKTEQNVELELDKISVKNSTAELIDLLTQLVQANIEEEHLGNMGAPTALVETSKQKYQQILDKLKTFKK